jgi:hypothetical protein
MHYDIDLAGTPATRRRNPPAKAAQQLPDQKPAPVLVPAAQVVHGIFAPCGRKLGFIVYGKFDMNRFIALHQWGAREWLKSDALATRWNVTMVIGERAWLKAISSDENPPRGIAFSFL